MNAAFHQQRTGAATLHVGEPETTEVAHPGSVLVALIDHDVLGGPQPSRKFEIAGMGACEQQWVTLLVHGMQVQQPVRTLEVRKQSSRPRASVWAYAR